VRVLDRGRNPCAIVTASIAGIDAPSAVAILRERGINTSASLGWYGLYDFAEKGVDSALRLSPHYYNTEAEVDSAIAAIGEIAAGARR
jgi:selenocysteine lyase/cysteine desulfurase